VLGAVALIVFMVAVFPVGFFLTGALASALHGVLLSNDADARHEGSELIDLNA
jgi:hypothetical protein